MACIPQHWLDNSWLMDYFYWGIKHLASQISIRTWMWKEHSVSFLIQCTNINLISRHEQLSVQYLPNWRHTFTYFLHIYLTIFEERGIQTCTFLAVYLSNVSTWQACVTGIPDFNRVSVYQCLLNSGQQEILHGYERFLKQMRLIVFIGT